MIKVIVSFFVWLTFAPLFAFGYRNKCYGKKYLPRDRGVMIASNHVSFLDPPLIGYCVYPIRFCYLARDTLFKGFVGWVLTNISCYPVKRGKGNVALFKLIPKLTAEGKTVAIFPEGTRSLDGELQEGQAGVGLLVQKTNAPVVPCYVHGTFKAWGPKQKYPKLWGKTAVIFGKPITFVEKPGQDRKEGQKEIVATIMEKIAGLKKWYLEGAVGDPP